MPIQRKEANERLKSRGTKTKDCNQQKKKQLTTQITKEKTKEP